MEDVVLCEQRPGGSGTGRVGYCDGPGGSALGLE